MAIENEDRIQKLLNQSRKRHIEEKYGGLFSRDDNDIPAELESDWLDSIEDFEQRMDAADEIKVREYIGNPHVVPPDEVAPADIHRKLTELVDLLDENNIDVYFEGTVPEEEMYRFIAGELLDAEISDVRIEGMVQTYIYQEFHPDDRLDAMMYADLFIRRVFTGAQKDILPLTSCSDSGDREAILEKIRAFRSNIAAFLHADVATTDCTVECDQAKVLAGWTCEQLGSDSLVRTTRTGTASVYLRRDEFGGWLVMDADFDPPTL